jgi:hypothetical protein
MPLPDDLLGDIRARYEPEHVPQTFIETGTHRGDGVQCAIDAGFEAIHSVDIAPFCYGWASHRFADVRTQVHLYLGDSRAFLRRMIQGLNSQAVFWLDSHYCGGDGEMQGRDDEFNVPAPLRDELKIIAAHRIKRHIVLVDDMRMMGQDVFPSQDDVMAGLRAINPDYTFTRTDSRDFPDDILIAEVPS